MSSPQVEAVRGVYEQWAEGDFRGGVELYDPFVLLVISPEFPDSGTYVGVEAVARYMGGFLEPWTRLTIASEEIVGAGDSVVVAVSQCGVGGSSGVATELRYFHVWSFRGGRVIRLETFRERGEALAAVGLPG